MTFEEAKEILDEELCFVIEKNKDAAPVDVHVKFPEWEKLSVKEAIIALKKLGYDVYYDMDFPAYHYRQKMLQKEKEERVASGKVELCQKEGNPINIVNDRLKEKAEELSDSILDELVAGFESNKRRGKEVSKLNKVIQRKNQTIKNLIHDHGKMVNKLAKLTADLEVNKVNMQALKSAESALAYKDRELNKKDEAFGEYSNMLADAYDEIRELREKLKTSEAIKKEYVDYGIGANNFIKKICSAYVDAHERGKYSLSALFAGRKYKYDGLSPKDAFEYAKDNGDSFYNKLADEETVDPNKEGDEAKQEELDWEELKKNLLKL